MKYLPRRHRRRRFRLRYLQGLSALYLNLRARRQFARRPRRAWVFPRPQNWFQELLNNNAPYTPIDHTPLYITIHFSTFPYTIIHHHTPLHITIHHYTSPYIPIDHHTPLHITIHPYTSPYTPIHHHTPLYITIHPYTSPYIPIHSHTLLYITIHPYT